MNIFELRFFLSNITSVLNGALQEAAQLHGKNTESAFDHFCRFVETILKHEVDLWRRAKIAELAKTRGYIEHHSSQ